MRAIINFFYDIGLVIWFIIVVVLKMALVAFILLLPALLETLFDIFLS